jgi:hypothetical protein
MARRYEYEVQRLVDDRGTGYLGGMTTYDPPTGVRGKLPRKYPTFKSEATAERFIVRKRIVARVQRYALEDGTRFTSGAGQIIDARPASEYGKGLMGAHPKRPPRRSGRRR